MISKITFKGVYFQKRKSETERQLELSRLEVQLLREQLALQKLEISKQQAKTKSVEVGFFLFRIVMSFNLFDRGEYFF